MILFSDNYVNIFLDKSKYYFIRNFLFTFPDYHDMINLCKKSENHTKKGIIGMKQKNESGIIFNIQKFSLNDGPGIRTVVFFKGCPLRCKWCANPESQDPTIQSLWDETSNEYIKEGKFMSVEQVINICLQDVDFYEESGGGVTLSGGEAFMHPSFALTLLRELKTKGIHTAIETTGFTPSEVFQKITPYIDLFLFDVKHWNCIKHKEGTGVSNEHILQNLKWAIDSGKEVLPRLPVIPGYNNSISDVREFSHLLLSLGAHKVQLLPFHQFGEKKYEMLDKDYVYKNVPALHEEDLKEFQQIFLDNNIHAFF